jgi:diguanylate cyclase (GGDEF)-like protein
VFDKNSNRITQSDPIFETLFENITELSVLNTFLAQNAMLDEDFLHKLSIDGKEHHLCYQRKDLSESFEFHFFLLSDEWSVINPTGGCDIYDQLTGLRNEKNILSLLKHEINRASRDKNSSATLIIDINHLKNINEMFGYLAGDYVLQEVSKTVMENTRLSDATGRYKGDKLVVLLYKTDAHGAMQYIKRFDERFEQIALSFNGFSFDIEFNFGVTISKEEDTVGTLLERANKALSKAKKSRTTHVEFLL